MKSKGCTAGCMDHAAQTAGTKKACVAGGQEGRWIC